MASPKAKVNPDLLVWAREDSGYSVEEAAAKLNVKPERLSSWESGEDRPTMNQVRALSDVYKRPVALFFMPQRPDGFQVIRDFRRLPGRTTRALSPALRLELRRAQERRSMALDLAADADLKVPTFKLRCNLGDDPEDVGATIRGALADRAPEPLNQTFRDWRTNVERLGVLIFIMPYLPTSEVRGFSISEDKFPVIGINRKDVPAARLFTLIHEFTHLMLRTSGICDIGEDEARRPNEQKVEVFCNAVAGSTLVPETELRAHELVVDHPRGDPTWGDYELTELGTSFGVSREVILRRLLKLKRTTQAFYREKRGQFLSEQRAHDNQASENNQNNEMKRNIPIETISILGRPFVQLALDNYHQQRLSLNGLSEVLGVKVRHVPNIERRIMSAPL